MFYYIQVGTTFVVFILVGILNAYHWWFDLLLTTRLLLHRSEAYGAWYRYFMVKGSAMVASLLWHFCLLKGEANAYFCHVNFA